MTSLVLKYKNNAEETLEVSAARYNPGKKSLIATTLERGDIVIDPEHTPELWKAIKKSGIKIENPIKIPEPPQPVSLEKDISVSAMIVDGSAVITPIGTIVHKDDRVLNLIILTATRTMLIVADPEVINTLMADGWRRTGAE